MKNWGLALKILLLSSMISISTFAQDLPPDDDEVPVDGGITVLIALAAAWGIRRVRNENK